MWVTWAAEAGRIACLWRLVGWSVLGEKSARVCRSLRSAVALGGRLLGLFGASVIDLSFTEEGVSCPFACAAGGVCARGAGKFAASW